VFKCYGTVSHWGRPHLAGRCAEFSSAAFSFCTIVKLCHKLSLYIALAWVSPAWVSSAGLGSVQLRAFFLVMTLRRFQSQRNSKRYCSLGRLVNLSGPVDLGMTLRKSEVSKYLGLQNLGVTPNLGLSKCQQSQWLGRQ
jgi:hypothetical protein